MVEKTLTVIRIAKRLKDPEHSCGSPTIASSPEVRVLSYTKLDMLPQLCRGILEVIAIQSTLIISGLQEPSLGGALLVDTEVGNEWGDHVYEVRPITRDD